MARLGPSRYSSQMAKARRIASNELAYTNPPAGRPSVGRTEVDRARVDDADPQEATFRQGDEVLVADGRAEVDRGVDQRIGAGRQDGSPALEVPIGRVALGGAETVDVVVDDGGPGREAVQCIRGDLFGGHRDVRVVLLGGGAVDGCLDDHRCRHVASLSPEDVTDRSSRCRARFSGSTPGMVAGVLRRAVSAAAGRGWEGHDGSFPVGRVQRAPGVGAGVVAAALAAVVCVPVGLGSLGPSGGGPGQVATGNGRRQEAVRIHGGARDVRRPDPADGNPRQSRLFAERTLPTDLYIPKAATPRPLIMFSHGYHGVPSNFSLLFSAWARAGYMVAAPQFPLTSNRGAPYDDVADYVNQPADISFVLTRLLHGPLRSHIDASQIGAAGLSLGGATTYGLVFDPCCIDRRIRSAAIFDGIRLPFPRPFQKNKIPVLIAHINTDIAIPYASAQASYEATARPKWFLTYFGGIHPEAYENEASPHHESARRTSIDFFDLTLLGDTSARARLMRDGANPGESMIVAG